MPRQQSRVGFVLKKKIAEEYCVFLSLGVVNFKGLDISHTATFKGG